MKCTISCPTWWRTPAQKPTSCPSSSTCYLSETTTTSGESFFALLPFFRAEDCMIFKISKIFLRLKQLLMFRLFVFGQLWTVDHFEVMRVPRVPLKRWELCWKCQNVEIALVTLMTDKSADHTECGETQGNDAGFNSEIPTWWGVLKLKLIKYNISQARLIHTGMVEQNENDLNVCKHCKWQHYMYNKMCTVLFCNYKVFVCFWGWCGGVFMERLPVL